MTALVIWRSMIWSATFFAIGNFVYQFFKSDPDYWVAFERSWFQVCGILVSTAILVRELRRLGLIP